MKPGVSQDGQVQRKLHTIFTPIWVSTRFLHLLFQMLHTTVAPRYSVHCVVNDLGGFADTPNTDIHEVSVGLLPWRESKIGPPQLFKGPHKTIFLFITVTCAGHWFFDNSPEKEIQYVFGGLVVLHTLAERRR